MQRKKLKANIIANNKKQVEFESWSPEMLKQFLISWMNVNAYRLSDQFNADQVAKARPVISDSLINRDTACMVGKAVINFEY